MPIHWYSNGYWIKCKRKDGRKEEGRKDGRKGGKGREGGRKGGGRIDEITSTILQYDWLIHKLPCGSAKGSKAESFLKFLFRR